MGCSVGTVKSTTSRALERLRLVVEAPVAAESDRSMVDKNDTNDTKSPNSTNGESVTTHGVHKNEGSVTR